MTSSRCSAESPSYGLQEERRGGKNVPEKREENTSKTPLGLTDARTPRGTPEEPCKRVPSTDTRVERAPIHRTLAEPMSV
jgi:hypothetical protein